MSTVASPALKSWQAAFESQPAPSDAQRQAFAAFLAAGIPNTKVDAWKYTDLRRLTMKSFRQPDRSVPTRSAFAAESALLPIESSHRIVFVDGIVSEPLPFAPGIAVTLTRQDALKEATSPAQAFEFLNAALAADQLHIDIGAELTGEPIIYIAYVWTHASGGRMTHPNVAINVAPGSRITLIEHHLGANAEANFCNGTTLLSLETNAAVEHLRLQDDTPNNFNIASCRVQVAAGASYATHQYIVGGGLSRTDLRVSLNGTDAHAELHGLIYAQQAQHLDVRTCIEHVAPQTTSREDFRGIADHRGRVVFNGKVIVAQDAQRSDAAQSSRNLLLSPHAEIDTRPELEIYADDVKCAHGATVGQLDANALFYLQSRGIALDEARALLTQAFAAEVIDRIPIEAVREQVLAKLLPHLRTGGNR